MKAIILARVSSREQEDNNSIPAQTRRLTEYTERKQLDVIEVCQLVESSTKANRKRYSEIIGRIKRSSGEIALVTDTIDRLQRDFKESVMLDEIRKTGKLQLHFVRENLIIHKESTSSDLMRWDMGVMFAKSYVTQLSDNVRRSTEQKRRNGEWSGKAPFGYKNVDLANGRKWIEPDDNAPIVQQIFEWYTSRSHSIAGIKRLLYSEYRLALATSSIHKILKRPFYHGVMRVKGEDYAHRYTTILSKEMYDSAQRIASGRNEKPMKYAGLPYPYRGLIRCAHCGCSITPERSKSYVYYHCTQYGGNHGAKYVREEELTRQLQKAFDAIRPTQEQCAQVCEALRTANADKVSYKAAHTSRLRAELTKIENRSTRLYDSYLDGDITKELYREKSVAFKINTQEVQQKLATLDNASDEFYESAIQVMELARDASDFFKSSELSQKRQLLDMVLQNLELCDDQLRWKYKKPFDSMASCTNNSSWLGWRDSNPRMLEPEPSALPLGDIPIRDEQSLLYSFNASFSTAETEGQSTTLSRMP